MLSVLVFVRRRTRLGGGASSLLDDMAPARSGTWAQVADDMAPARASCQLILEVLLQHRNNLGDDGNQKIFKLFSLQIDLKKPADKTKAGATHLSSKSRFARRLTSISLALMPFCSLRHLGIGTGVEAALTFAAALPLALAALAALCFASGAACPARDSDLDYLHSAGVEIVDYTMLLILLGSFWTGIFDSFVIRRLIQASL